MRIQGAEQKVCAEEKKPSSDEELGGKNNTQNKEKRSEYLLKELNASKAYKETSGTHEKRTKAEEINDQTSGKGVDGLMKEGKVNVHKKKGKGGTFKRLERTKTSQTGSVSEPDPKKRGAIAMEIEEEADNAKKARMVVDSEGGKEIQVNSSLVISENCLGTKNAVVEHKFDMKAGLTDQSRGTK